MKVKLAEIDWNAWLYGRGMPPVAPAFDSTLATPAYTLAKRWTDAAAEDVDPGKLDFSAKDLKGWFAGQICMSPL